MNRLTSLRVRLVKISRPRTMTLLQSVTKNLSPVYSTTLVNNMMLNRNTTKCANRAVEVVFMESFVPASRQTREGSVFTRTGARPLKKPLDVLMVTRL